MKQSSANGSVTHLGELCHVIGARQYEVDGHPLDSVINQEARRSLRVFATELSAALAELATIQGFGRPDGPMEDR